jgi:hypothetical protein
MPDFNGEGFLSAIWTRQLVVKNDIEKCGAAIGEPCELNTGAPRAEIEKAFRSRNCRNEVRQEMTAAEPGCDCQM